MRRRPAWRPREALRALAWGLAGLAALELMLQLAALVGGKPPVERPKGRILLLAGDTWALGPGGGGLPQRLEALLRERTKDPSVRVVSRLVPAEDTASLAQRLDEDLDELSPEAAVVLVGGQNSWASVRPEDAALRCAPAAWLGRLLYRSRVLRLGRILWWWLRYGTIRPYGDAVSGEQVGAAEVLALAADRLRRGPGAKDADGVSGATSEFEAVYDEAQELERREQYDRARGRYARLIQLWPTHPAGYLGGAICFMKEDRPNDAIVLLERAARLPPVPEHVEVFTQLGWAHERKGDHDAAARWWGEGLKRFPGSRSLFEALAKAQQERGDVWKALDAAKDNTALRSNPRYRLLARLASASGRGDMRALIRKSMAVDLRKICAAARRRGVSLVLASYPDPEAGVPAIAAAGGARHLDLGGASKDGRLDPGRLEALLAQGAGEALGGRGHAR